MPVKRAIMFDLRDNVLRYALRFDQITTPKPSYRSVYGDPNDPDLPGIRRGNIEELINSRDAAPQGEEDTDALLNRLRDEISAEWSAVASRKAANLTRAEIFGQSWDGRAWSDYVPPAPLSKAAIDRG